MFSHPIVSLIQPGTAYALMSQLQTFSRFTWANVFYAALVVVAMFLIVKLSRPALDALARRAPKWSFLFKMLVPVFRFGPWLIGAALIFAIFSPARDSFLAVLASAGTGLWHWVRDNW